MQFEKAMTLTLRVKATVKAEGGSLFLTGHSMGGCMASAASLRTKTMALTYNPSGVHSNTLKRHNMDLSEGERFISAYIVSGEMLNYLQTEKAHFKDIMPDPVGMQVKLAPNGIYFSRISLHLNDAILKTIK